MCGLFGRKFGRWSWHGRSLSRVTLNLDLCRDYWLRGWHGASRGRHGPVRLGLILCLGGGQPAYRHQLGFGFGDGVGGMIHPEQSQQMEQYHQQGTAQLRPSRRARRLPKGEWITALSARTRAEASHSNLILSHIVEAIHALAGNHAHGLGVSRRVRGNWEARTNGNAGVSQVTLMVLG